MPMTDTINTWIPARARLSGVPTDQGWSASIG